MFCFDLLSGDDISELSKLKESYKPRRRKAVSEIRGPTSLHQANSAELEDRAAAAGIRVQRRSIKRMSLARLRKTSEFSGLRPLGQNPQNPMANGLDDLDEPDHRRIVGLKRSKVPMMVYSHGGFSRCFRIARRYQVEGPPIGVEYEEDAEHPRNALNPEVQNAWSWNFTWSPFNFVSHWGERNCEQWEDNSIFDYFGMLSVLFFVVWLDEGSRSDKKSGTHKK